MEEKVLEEMEEELKEKNWGVKFDQNTSYELMKFSNNKKTLKILCHQIKHFYDYPL